MVNKRSRSLSLSSPGYQSPIDDMLDGKDIDHWPDQLGQVISHIHTKLYEKYDHFDKSAIDEQRKHRKFAIIAVFFGSATIILAILQVCLLAFQNFEMNSLISSNIELIRSNQEFIKFFEIGCLFVGVIAVIVSWRYGHHKEWLENRFLAEQCRSLKFRALIHPYLWCSSELTWPERFTRWKERFNTEASGIEATYEKSLDDYLISDEIDTPPGDIIGCLADTQSFLELTEYYTMKRLSTQIDYFKNRAAYFGSIHKKTRRIPDYCYFGSILCATGAFGIELIFQNNHVFSLASLTLGLLALVLPIFGIGVRTLRSSVEVSRSAALFEAKARALIHFKLRLDEELRKEMIRWPEIFRILWQCENFLKNENLEWLRMMREAEWFI